MKTMTDLDTIKAAMPEGTVYIGERYDFDSRTEVLAVTIMGNHALGSALYAKVAARVGRLPEGMARSTGYVESMTALAAGLTLPDDDWYSDHTFLGDDEVTALADVFRTGEVVPVLKDSKKTVTLKVEA